MEPSLTSSDCGYSESCYQTSRRQTASPPTKFIVPNIDIVHNRVSVEIMRGCTRGCR
ncbi:MAG: hypothetical protein U0X93_08810 [Anaerolineales bacterium]